jgi:hypothetical protein
MGYEQAGRQQKLVWFGEIERKLAKLSMTTFTYQLLFLELDCLKRVKKHKMISQFIPVVCYTHIVVARERL